MGPYLSVKIFGSNFDSAIETMSLPYEKINPKAVAYVAGSENSVAYVLLVANIRVNPTDRTQWTRKTSVSRKEFRGENRDENIHSTATIQAYPD